MQRAAVWCTVCCVAGRSVSSLDVCHAMHDKASGASDSNQQHQWFPRDKNSTNMHSSATQKTVPMVYWAEDFVFLASFSLAILCDAIPCSELCFWIKVMPTAFIIHQDVVKKAVTFDSMCSSNYKKTFFTEVCASLSTIQETMGKDFPVPQTFHYLLDGMVPHSSLRYISVIVTCHFSWMNPLIFLCFSQHRQFAGNHYRLISNVLCSHF